MNRKIPLNKCVWEGLFQGIPIQVHALEALQDNYIYIISWGNQACVIDPGEAKPPVHFLEVHKLEPVAILITHHHSDHTGGLESIREKYDCTVFAPSESGVKRPNETVFDGEKITFRPLSILPLKTPGHTLDHYCYYLPKLGLLFSGDLLFAGGCGRIFEGDAPMMYRSIQRVLALPEGTYLFGGHEYTRANLAFARSVEPTNFSIEERIDQGTFPSTLKLERETNPFCRPDSLEIRSELGMASESDELVFGRLRELKNSFKS